MLEKSPRKLNYKQLLGLHHGFWQCMDTPRDKEFIKELLRRKKAPWLKKTEKLINVANMDLLQEIFFMKQTFGKIKVLITGHWFEGADDTYA